MPDKNAILVRKNSKSSTLIIEAGFAIPSDFSTELWLGWFTSDPSSWIDYYDAIDIIAVYHPEPQTLTCSRCRKVRRFSEFEADGLCFLCSQFVKDLRTLTYD